MRGRHVCVVGGGNAAGQAAAHLAKYADAGHAARARRLAREEHVGVPDRRAARHANVVGASRSRAGRRRGRRAAARRSSSATAPAARLERIPTAGLFVMIGAEPHTEWLDGTVERDERGFILTGGDLDRRRRLAARAAADAARDERPGRLRRRRRAPRSVKRVTTAMGEGATVDPAHPRAPRATTQLSSRKSVRELATRRHVELSKRPPEVRLDGGLGHEQRLRDLAVSGSATGDARSESASRRRRDRSWVGRTPIAASSARARPSRLQQPHREARISASSNGSRAASALAGGADRGAEGRAGTRAVSSRAGDGAQHLKRSCRPSAGCRRGAKPAGLGAERNPECPGGAERPARGEPIVGHRESLVVAAGLRRATAPPPIARASLRRLSTREPILDLARAQLLDRGLVVARRRANHRRGVAKLRLGENSVS